MSMDAILPMEGDEALFEPGEDFHGYTVEKPIGKGGLGSVWLIRHRVLDTLFALKVLDPEVAEQKPEYEKRFLREAKLATRMRHPNLVAVHDAGYDFGKGIYYLVMDYVKGNTLREIIAFEGARPEKDAVHVVLCVADVLAAAQCFGMVHRDLKPENIMITDDGVVKLLDLGIAKISDGFDSLKTTAKTVFGTPAYISPEQAEDSSAVDTRADIYSLGIILFEMLTGRSPYSGKKTAEILNLLLDQNPIPDVRSVNSNVSPKVAAVLSLMCAKRLEDRFATPKAVIEAFARLGFSLPTPTGTEFAVEGGVISEEMSMEDILASLVAKNGGSDSAGGCQKTVVVDLVTSRRRRRLRNWILAIAVMAGLLALALAIVCLV